MATVNPYQQNPLEAGRRTEFFLWQTAESGGDGVANGDTVTALEMPHSYAHVMMQLRNTVPASTTIAVLGGIDSDVSKMAPVLDAGGSALQLTAENAIVFLTGGVPPWIAFSCSGGTGGDMDVHLARKPI